MTEDQLEQETLAWLAEVGYSHAYGPDINEMLVISDGVAIADEAHRTQYGFKTKLRTRKVNYKQNRPVAPVLPS